MRRLTHTRCARFSARAGWRAVDPCGRGLRCALARRGTAPATTTTHAAANYRDAAAHASASATASAPPAVSATWQIDLDDDTNTAPPRRNSSTERCWCELGGGDSSIERSRRELGGRSGCDQNSYRRHDGHGQDGCSGLGGYQCAIVDICTARGGGRGHARFPRHGLAVGPYW